MKLGQKGLELIKMREELDNTAGNLMLINALSDYVKKSTTEKEYKLVIQSKSAAELRKKLEGMKEYGSTEVDLFDSRIETISKLITEHANPKRYSRSNPKKQYKFKYLLTGDFEEKTYALTRKFGLGEQFLRDYFGVLSAKDAKKLMEAGGFLNQYVSMRIPLVLTNILNGVHENNKKGLIFKISESYYEQSIDYFNVDLTIEFASQETNDSVARKLAIILSTIEDRFSVSESLTDAV